MRSRYETWLSLVTIPAVNEIASVLIVLEGLWEGDQGA